jgi:hypothetical protein
VVIRLRDLAVPVRGSVILIVRQEHDAATEFSQPASRAIPLAARDTLRGDARDWISRAGIKCCSYQVAEAARRVCGRCQFDSYGFWEPGLGRVERDGQAEGRRIRRDKKFCWGALDRLTVAGDCLIGLRAQFEWDKSHPFRL